MPDEPQVLLFDDVSLHFDEIPALDHVSFGVEPGDTRVVLGAAGSGKTTLLKTSLGLIKPDSGRVDLFSQDITGLGRVRSVRPPRQGRHPVSGGRAVRFNDRCG